MQQTKIALLPVSTRQRTSYEPKHPEQLGLWPLKVARVLPANESKGLHYAGEIIADNGFRYYVKTQQGAELSPYTEVLGYELCRALSIAVPQYDRIEMPGGDIAFGSRAEAASEDGDALADHLANSSDVHYTAGIQLSRLLAVDAFLGNLDRSFKNLRWLQANEAASRPSLLSNAPAAGAVIALDFGRAFTAVAWPLHAAGFPPGSRSKQFYGLMKAQSLFEAREIGFALDRLASLPNGFIEMVLLKCSPQWINNNTVEASVQWWQSPMRGARVEETERYLKDELKVSVFHS